jgi:hypothetical protein
MTDIEINDLSSIGVINDVKAYMLAPEAWTMARNMRYRNGAPESLFGWEQIFGTLPAPPHFVMPVSTQSTNLWIWASPQSIFVYDGNTHNDISRSVGGPYSAPPTESWNGTILGGIPIFNNGLDVPQYRPNMNAGTRFADLPNWPTGTRAEVVRAFSPYLMAFNITENGISRPHTIITSHPADPGSIPSSWDYTDPSKDTTIKDLDDVNSGVIIDALPLAGTMYVYKETATWRATKIGGRFIFDWKPLFETSGILAPRCVALTGDGTKHVVVTQDDMFWHNGIGGRQVSIIDKTQRTKLFGEMDTVNFGTSFLFCNPLNTEMWFCYPTQGSTQPNAAMIWNYGEGGERGVISFADGITFRNAAIGSIEGGNDEIWDQGQDTWDEDTGPWSEFTRRRVLLASPDSQKFFMLDRGETRDGVSFVQILQREGISLIGRSRKGEWIVDFQNRKMLQRIWPKIVGAPVAVRIGTQDLVDGPITWGPSVAFDSKALRAAINDPMSGAALAIEFQTLSKSWRIDGYKLSIAVLGQY